MDTSTPTLISLCTGYGGLELGIERALGRRCRVLASVEIEAFAVENLVAKISSGHLPATPIWSDLRTFPAEKFHGMVDILCGGYPCFGAGTMVLTWEGYRPIETLSIGDTVLTHKGRWRKITANMRRTNIPLRKIHAGGVYGLVTTDEHPFLARKKSFKWNNGIRRYERVFHEAEWVPAKNLAKLYVGQVLPPKRRDSRPADFWWVVGRYLADGWLQCAPSQRGKGRVNFGIGKHKAELFEAKLRKAGFSPCRSEQRTAIRFIITRKHFYQFLLQFGRYAHGKFLPGFIYHLSKEKAGALLDGYLSGDGYQADNPKGKGKYRRVTTVSKSLAYGIALLAQRAYGVVAGIRKYESELTTVIEGRTVNQRPIWVVTIPERNRSAFVKSDYGWKLVRKSKPCGDGTVFNISVEEDESYIADGAIVHNCQPFSHAGKRKGAEDPRHLWPYIARAIDAIRPRWVFLENVEGHITLGLREVLTDLVNLRYGVENSIGEPAWGIFSAAEVGAPHQRKRVFILAHSEYDGLPRPEISGGTGSRTGAQAGTVGTGQSAGSGCLPGRDKDVANAFSTGLQGREVEKWQGLDGYFGCSHPGLFLEWPARPGEPQYEWEPPRVIKPRPKSTFYKNLENASCLGRRRRGDGDAGGGERTLQIEGSCRSRGEELADSPDDNGGSGVRGEEEGVGPTKLRGERLAGGSQELVDPCCIGEIRQESEHGKRRGTTEAEQGGGREPESRPEPSVGRDITRAPNRMVSTDSRVDELRLLGNGVVPEQAAKAFITLYRRSRE